MDLIIVIAIWVSLWGILFFLGEKYGIKDNDGQDGICP